MKAEAAFRPIPSSSPTAAIRFGILRAFQKVLTANISCLSGMDMKNVKRSR